VSTELELGFDIAVMDDRVSGAFTWYNQKTVDALVNLSPEPSTGLSGSLASNLGRIDNWGYEATLNILAYQSDNVNVDLALAADYTNNEIKELGSYPGTTSIQVGYPYPNVINYFNVVDVGPEVDEFGRPTNITCDLGVFLDGSDADPDVQPEPGVFPGGRHVPCSEAAGLRPIMGRDYYTNTFSIAPTVTLFQDFRLFATAQGMYGKVGYDSQVGWGLRYNNGYCTQALQNDPACGEWMAANRDGLYRDEWSQWAFDADFWKLREVGLQYEMPESLVARAGATRASFTVAVRDLWTLWRAQETMGRPVTEGFANTPRRHIPDSEYQDLYRLPPLSSVQATLRVSF
jgi:hypothetical protein